MHSVVFVVDFRTLPGVGLQVSMGMTTDEAITRLKQFSQIKSFTGYLGGEVASPSCGGGAGDSFVAHLVTPTSTLRPRLRSLQKKAR